MSGYDLLLCVGVVTVNDWLQSGSNWQHVSVVTPMFTSVR